MAKRLTPFIGLAVVAALAIAAAFGAFSLNPAQAAVDAPNARGLAQPVDFQSQATALAAPATAIETSAANTPVTTIVAGDNPVGNMRLAVGESITIDLRDSIKNTAAVVDGNAANINAYQLDAPMPSGDPANPNPDHGVVTLSPSVDGTDADTEPDGVSTGNILVAAATTNLRNSTSTEVTITAAKAGKATLTIWAYNFDTTARSGAGEVGHSNRTFSIVVVAPDLTLADSDPGENTRYDVTFVSTEDLVAGVSEVTIELEDFDFPGSTIPSAVGISSDAYFNSETDDRRLVAVADAGWNEDGSRIAPASSYQGGLITPDDVSISGEKITISVPDMNPENDRGDNINAGDFVRVVIRQGAGVSNPSEGGDYPAVITTNVSGGITQTSDEENVPRLVTLNEEDGGRGTVVTATGKGFKNGTTLAFFLDKRTVHVDDDNNPDTPASRDNGVDEDGDDATDEEGEVDGLAYRVPNGLRDVGEVVLCNVSRVSSDDTGSCDFTVSNPPFIVGDQNFVGAVDGRGQTANKSATNNDSDQQFKLTPTISAAPASGNPGDTILIQMYDFPPNSSVTLVDLARQQELATARGQTTQNTVSFTSTGIGADGSANFQMTVPNWAPEGVLDLKVTAGGESDNITITVGGPEVTATPSTVLANQRINLVGSGFSPNSRVCCGTQGTGEVQDPEITIGGTEIMAARINDGEDVTVDNGGNWSASINLPLIQATADEGTREIVVRDSKGRSGSVDVTIPARSVTIDPPVGRAGTVAIVRGENFPSKNDGGDSFNVEITYTASGNNSVQVTTVPDASGRFEAEIRIPTSANIPSTNTVRVVYEDSNDVTVTTTVTHQVPEGALSLSQNSGPPDSTVTVLGEGFRASVPIQSVKVGDIEVTPTPRPSTSRQGGFEFDILIPGVDTGIQTVEVRVSGTTASVGFNVTDVAEAGAETAVATGIANLGDNFVRAFYFDNISKAWSFYDPEVADSSTLSHFIAGASYWVLIGATQEEVILNRKTRNLYCGDDGNCWNLIVW